MNARQYRDHYVSQCLLRQFRDEKGLLYTCAIGSRIVNTHSDTRYICQKGNWSTSRKIEGMFANIEAKAASLLYRINSNPYIAHTWSIESRLSLVEFILSHILRSTYYQQLVEDFIDFKNRLEQKKHTSNLSIREEGIIDIATSIPELRVALSTMNCISLTIKNDKDVFILSDNPLVKLSSTEYYVYRGNAYHDSTYYWFPLGPKVGLFFGRFNGKKALHTKHGVIESRIAPTKLINLLNRASISNSIEIAICSKKNFLKGKSKLFPKEIKTFTVDCVGPIMSMRPTNVHDMDQSLCEKVFGT